MLRLSVSSPGIIIANRYYINLFCDLFLINGSVVLIFPLYSAFTLFTNQILCNQSFNDNSHGKICQLANFSRVFRTGSYEKHNGTGEFQNIGQFGESTIVWQKKDGIEIYLFSFSRKLDLKTPVFGKSPIFGTIFRICDPEAILEPLSRPYILVFRATSDLKQSNHYFTHRILSTGSSKLPQKICQLANFSFFKNFKKTCTSSNGGTSISTQNVVLWTRMKVLVKIYPKVWPIFVIFGENLF